MQETTNPVSPQLRPLRLCPDRAVCLPAPARGTLILGLIGAVLFPAACLLDGALRPGYRTLVDPISALAIGPGGWAQIADFILYGVLMIISAYGWRRVLVRGPVAVLYPSARILSGLALIATGIVHQGPIHNVVSYLSLIATVAGLFILAARLHRSPGWRGWASTAMVTAVLEMGLLAAFGRLTTPSGGGGVFEKLATIIVAAFIVALTARVLKRDSVLPPYTTGNGAL